MTSRFASTALAAALLTPFQASAGVVAYSNLGSGDKFSPKGFSVEPVCDSAVITGYVFAVLPTESGLLGTVELGLRHVKGVNEWIVGLNDSEWPVAAAERPHRLVAIDTSSAGIEVVADEWFFVTVRHAEFCCDGPDSRAGWYSNVQGEEMHIGVKVVLPICTEQEVWYEQIEGDEPAIRLTLQDTCPADCDLSGALDLFDFLCFSNLFNAEDQEADCDGDGQLGQFDFLCFVNAYNGGC